RRGVIILEREQVDFLDCPWAGEVHLEPIGIFIRRGVIPDSTRTPPRAASVTVNGTIRFIPAEERRPRCRRAIGRRRDIDRRGTGSSESPPRTAVCLRDAESIACAHLPEHRCELARRQNRGTGGRRRHPASATDRVV